MPRKVPSRGAPPGAPHPYVRRGARRSESPRPRRRQRGLLRLLTLPLTALAVASGGALVEPVGAQPIGGLAIPQPPGPPPRPPNGVDIIELPRDVAETGRAVIPLGTVNLGELTPVPGTQWKRGELTIAVTSAFGYFPRYKIMARAVTAPGAPAGGLTTADVGLGVINVTARAPRVNPTYDYDPSTAPKDVDEEPIFQGTIESLGVIAPGDELFRSRGFFFGNWNQFTLVFAVGPQFYTPGPPLSVQIELELLLL